MCEHCKNSKSEKINKNKRKRMGKNIEGSPFEYWTVIKKITTGDK